ncbi:LLM class flavin-dependent oxidoreductase [Novosphingobium sp.]|uniref:LLM class flavin-dependent oxidoreductase n=1 Tax=Novosphingobium sp. TaxID=1874826 RepID=UPI0031E385D9
MTMPSLAHTLGDLEIIGIVNHRSGGVGDPPPAHDFEPDFIRDVARLQEAAGYDRVLIANAATMPESFALGTFLAPQTSRLAFMMAHRPGFIAPTVAARHLATIDRLSGGRAGVHIIVGADDREVQADGAFNTKEHRYRMAGEYVEVMRKMWSTPTPFDHEGEFYTFKGAHAMVRPEKGAIPVYFGGTSDLALDMCGQYADVYALAGETQAGAGALAARAHAAAARHNRQIKVLMTMVIILGETEAAAKARAAALYDKVVAQVNAGARGIMANHEKDGDKASAGAFQRLAEQAAQGEWQDQCLWTGLNKAYNGRGNNSVLVGTHEQVASSLMRYRQLGITRFLLRGPDQINDAVDIGGKLVPNLRRMIAEQETQPA